jgi:hypothetical protein
LYPDQCIASSSGGNCGGTYWSGSYSATVSGSDTFEPGLYWVVYWEVGTQNTGFRAPAVGSLISIGLGDAFGTAQAIGYTVAYAGTHPTFPAQFPAITSAAQKTANPMGIAFQYSN